MSGRKTLTLFALVGALSGALTGVLGACGHAPRASPSNTGSSEARVTLYRDGARVRQPLTVRATGTDAQTISVVVPEGADPADAKLVDAADLTWSREESEDSEDAPAKATFVVRANKPGMYRVAVEYIVPALSWSAAYTLTTTPARSSVTVRGAIGLTNGLGAPLSKMHVLLVDDFLAATGKSTQLDLGERDVPAGDSRIELLANDAPRALHAVLVYDPIGTQLDETDGTPNSDPDMTEHIAKSPRLTEGYEITRPASQPPGLPHGRGRLFERNANGQLHLLGQAELFGAQTRAATVDTLAIGDAQGVTGSREQRDLTNDLTTHRLSEEFAITVTNTRALPVEVVVREHLYRGATYAIGYVSTPTQQEGPQQFAMRVNVPARGTARVVYVVVYTGPP